MFQSSLPPYLNSTKFLSNILMFHPVCENLDRRRPCRSSRPITEGLVVRIQLHPVLCRPRALERDTNQLMMARHASVQLWRYTCTVPPPVRMKNIFNVTALSEKWVMNSLVLFHNRWWCHRPSTHGRYRHQGEEKLLDAERCAGAGDGQGEMEQKK